MLKAFFLKMSTIGWLFSLLVLLVACGGTATGTGNNTFVTNTPVTTNTPVEGIATASQTDFAATVEGSGPVNRDAQGDNLTTIHSPVDRPVAKFTQTTLNVPPRAKGVVIIQNDSSNPMTLVSDTANGFPTFTIEHDTARTLIFYRTGTFKAHLQNYPISADTTLTIIITVPNL